MVLIKIMPSKFNEWLMNERGTHMRPSRKQLHELPKQFESRVKYIDRNEY